MMDMDQAVVNRRTMVILILTMVKEGIRMIMGMAEKVGAVVERGSR